MKPLLISIFVLLPICSNSALFAQSAESEAIYAYMKDQTCFGKDAAYIAKNGCLQNQKFRVIRKGGRGVNLYHVYRWNFSSPPRSTPLYPHFLVGYLKLLRNAVAAGKSDCRHIGRTGNVLDTYPCLSLLEDQLRYMESQADTPNNLIVWNQGRQYPSAMVQAEIAYMYMNIAVILKNKGHDDAAYDLFVKGNKIAASLDRIQAPNNGGVRSKTYPCTGGNCWLYHSSQRDRQDFALNQQAHVIQDAIYFYFQFSQFPQARSSPQTLYRTREKLINRFLKPLQLLASHSYPNVPDISRFMEKRGGGVNYYWSYYKLNPSTLNGENIGFENVCKYHKHTLDVFYNIFHAFKINSKKNRKLYNFLHDESIQQHQGMLEDINRAFEELLDARRGPKGQRRVEGIGQKDSNNALFQFFLSETDRRAKQDAQGCSHPELDSEVFNNYRAFFNID